MLCNDGEPSSLNFSFFLVSANRGAGVIQNSRD